MKRKLTVFAVATALSMIGLCFAKESFGQSKPKTPPAPAEVWYVTALEDSVVLFETLKPLYQLQIGVISEQGRKIQLLEKALQLEKEISGQVIAGLQKQVAALSGKLRLRQLWGYLKTAAGAVVVFILIFK